MKPVHGPKQPTGVLRIWRPNFRGNNLTSSVDLERQKSLEPMLWHVLWALCFVQASSFTGLFEKLAEILGFI